MTLNQVKVTQTIKPHVYPSSRFWVTTSANDMRMIHTYTTWNWPPSWTSLGYWSPTFIHHVNNAVWVKSTPCYPSIRQQSWNPGNPGPWLEPLCQGKGQRSNKARNIFSNFMVILYGLWDKAHQTYGHIIWPCKVTEGQSKIVSKKPYVGLPIHI